jgi:arylformamidase
MPATPCFHVGDFKGFRGAENARQYSPSSRTRNHQQILDDYRRLSETELLGHVNRVCARYGDDDDAVVVLTAAMSQSAPVHIFIHGGYWQELSWRDSFFPAGGFTAAGVTFGALNYSLAPKASLSTIVEQCRRAVAFLATRLLEAGGNGRISLSGSSAGAHLAAMLTLTQWSEFGLSHDPIAAVILMSGIYDLEPLLDTTINTALQLTRTAARRLSPLQIAPLAARPTLICWGEQETEVFKWQSAAFARHLNLFGGSVECIEARGRNHFDIVFDLSDPATQLGAAALSLIRDRE